MEQTLITVEYKPVNGKRISVEVSPEVKEVLEQTDRKLRSQGRQDRRHLDLREYIDGVSDTTDIYPQEDIADIIIRMDRYSQLYAAMKTLTARQQRRVRLYFFEGLTYRRIGEMEGVGFKTIHDSVSHAIQKMRKYIDK